MHVTHDRLDLTAVAGLVCLAIGLVLLGVGSVALVRAMPGWWKLLTIPAALVLLLFVLYPMPNALYATNVPRPAVGTATPADRELDFVDAEFVTADGVTLSGWYLPSSNGAAVVLLHGASSTRTAVLDQAAVLAEHGYGVRSTTPAGTGGAAEPLWTSAGTATSTSPRRFPTWRAARRSTRPDSVPSACQWAASRWSALRRLTPGSAQSSAKGSPVAASPTKAGSPGTGAAGSSAASTRRSTAPRTCSPMPHRRSACGTQSLRPPPAGPSHRRWSDHGQPRGGRRPVDPGWLTEHRRPVGRTGHRAHSRAAHSARGMAGHCPRFLDNELLR